MLFLTSLLVFSGLFLVGNPVDILVNPVADEVERTRAAAALGLDKPVIEQYWLFCAGHSAASSAPASCSVGPQSR